MADDEEGRDEREEDDDAANSESNESEGPSGCEEVTGGAGRDGDALHCVMADSETPGGAAQDEGHTAASVNQHQRVVLRPRLCFMRG